MKATSSTLTGRERGMCGIITRRGRATASSSTSFVDGDIFGQSGDKCLSCSAPCAGCGRTRELASGRTDIIPGSNAAPYSACHRNHLLHPISAGLTITWHHFRTSRRLRQEHMRQSTYANSNLAVCAVVIMFYRQTSCPISIVGSCERMLALAIVMGAN